MQKKLPGFQGNNKVEIHIGYMIVFYQPNITKKLHLNFNIIVHVFSFLADFIPDYHLITMCLCKCRAVVLK